MNPKSPIEQSAEKYLKGKIKIESIAQFTKYQQDSPDSYRTYKGAFIFPISGACEIYFDNECFLAHPGVMIHGCPNKNVCFHVISQEPFRYINLYYRTNDTFLFQCTLDNYPQLYQILSKLLDYYNETDEDNHIYEKNILLSQIFDSIYREYILPEARSNSDLVNEVALYIQEHYMMELTLDFLAGIFSKTSNQLSYLFYTYKGMRPIQFLITCRLSAACSLLITTTLPIYEISHMVGYKDPLFFSRLFKKHKGCSPKHFRTKYGQNYNNLLSNQDNALL